MSYKNDTAQLITQRFQAFVVSFEHMRTSLDMLKTWNQGQERQSAPRFNLFQLLGVARDEVRTHSALLADLLTPQGTHGQGTLFLDAFLTHCQQKWTGFPRPQDTTASALWTVGPKNTHWGNLDLVIASHECKLLLVIENKIGAGEQRDQLWRYAQWMQQQTLYPCTGQALLYLTPDGRCSTTAAAAPYYPLSYHEDITAWLSNTLNKVDAPHVRAALMQYLDILTTL
jgi:hypothetical protein